MKMSFGLGWFEMIYSDSWGYVTSLFSTPVVKINIERSFTKDELDCFANIPMDGKPIKIINDPTQGLLNHQSKDFYLFDTFAEELKEIKTFCEHQLKNYLRK